MRSEAWRKLPRIGRPQHKATRLFARLAHVRIQALRHGRHNNAMLSRMLRHKCTCTASRHHCMIITSWGYPVVMPDCRSCFGNRGALATSAAGSSPLTWAERDTHCTQSRRALWDARAQHNPCRKTYRPSLEGSRYKRAFACLRIALSMCTPDHWTSTI